MPFQWSDLSAHCLSQSLLNEGTPCLLSWGEAVQNVNSHYSESCQQGSSKFPCYLNRNDERARVLERGSTLGIGWCLPSWGGCWQSQVSHWGWASKGIWADRMSALHGARATWQSLASVFQVTVFIRITSWKFSAIFLDDVFFENRTWEPSSGPFNNHQTPLYLGKWYLHQRPRKPCWGQLCLRIPGSLHLSTFSYLRCHFGKFFSSGWESVEEEFRFFWLSN